MEAKLNKKKISRRGLLKFATTITAMQATNANATSSIKNLIESNNNLYFTSANGVYSINRNTGFTQQLCNINSDVLFVRTEEYDDNDSTTVSSYSQMLYVNDINNNSNNIYKFNVGLMSFTDTIITNSRVRYINEY